MKERQKAENQSNKQIKRSTCAGKRWCKAMKNLWLWRIFVSYANSLQYLFLKKRVPFDRKISQTIVERVRNYMYVGQTWPVTYGKSWRKIGGQLSTACMDNCLLSTQLNDQWKHPFFSKKKNLLFYTGEEFVIFTGTKVVRNRNIYPYL